MATSDAPADERFSWTSELIDAVLALRFKDSLLADAIDRARGNDAKRAAWTALAEALQKTRGVDVPETKIRRAISKWQSQHRSWVQAMATKNPADLMPSDRPPTYMPVLQRYFDENEGPSSVDKSAPRGVRADAAAPSTSPTLTLESFEDAMKALSPAEPKKGTVEPDAPITSPKNPPPVTPSVSTDAVVRAKTSRQATRRKQDPLPERSESPKRAKINKHVVATQPQLISQDSEEDPETSQEDIQSLFQTGTTTNSHFEMQPALVSPDRNTVVPPRPARVGSTSHTLPLKQAFRGVQVTPQSESTGVRELMVSVTQHLSSIHQEQIQLQRKHFEERLLIERKHYEEQFAIQHKQVEAIQAVLESIQGSVII